MRVVTPLSPPVAEIVWKTLPCGFNIFKLGILYHMNLHAERCKLVTRTGTHVHESGQVWILPCQIAENNTTCTAGHAATTSVDTIKQTSNRIESRTDFDINCGNSASSTSKYCTAVVETEVGPTCNIVASIATSKVPNMPSKVSRAQL